MKTMMKSYTIVFLFLGIFNKLSSQDSLFLRYKISNSEAYTTDTLLKQVPFGPNFLFETCWLSERPNFQYGLIPDTLKISCDEKDYREGEQTTVQSIANSDTLLIARIDIVENCCFSFICNYSIRNDSILDFTYLGYGSTCGCMCKHKLEYRLKVDNTDKQKVCTFEKVRYISFNNEFLRKFR